MGAGAFYEWSIKYRPCGRKGGEIPATAAFSLSTDTGKPGYTKPSRFFTGATASAEISGCASVEDGWIRTR